MFFWGRMVSLFGGEGGSLSLWEVWGMMCFHLYVINIDFDMLDVVNLYYFVNRRSPKILCIQNLYIKIAVI